METVILVIHLMLALAIIGLVLLQRSEGGGLGIGGGGGGLGGFATAAATTNVLTRATAICAGLFFVTSLTLAVLAGTHRSETSILDSLDEPVAAITIEDQNAQDSTSTTGKDTKKAQEAPSAPISE